MCKLRLIIACIVLAACGKQSPPAAPTAATVARTPAAQASQSPAAIEAGTIPGSQEGETAQSFARFLTIFTNEGRVDGKRYLKNETLRTFLDATPIPTATGVSYQQGLVWEIRGKGDDVIVEHAGIDPGATTLASVKPKKGTAALAFANVTGHKELGRFMRETIERLHDKA